MDSILASLPLSILSRRFERGCLLIIAFWYAEASADTLWTKTYGGPNDDHGCSVIETADYGYLITGYTSSFGNGGFDLYVIKTNSAGDTLWTKTYGGTSNDYGRSGQIAPGAGYAVGGYTWSFGQGGSDFYLVRIDQNGDTVWTRTYGGTGYDEAYSLAVTPDRGYLLAGSTNSFGAGAFDVYVVKTDSLGLMEWARTYGGTENDEAYSVQPTQDGGYIVAGATRSFGLTDGAVYLIRIDSTGDTLWTKTFAWASDDRGYAVLPAADGSYIVAGSGYTVGLAYDMLYLKATSTGQSAWHTYNGGLRDDCAYAIREIPGRGYLIAGNFHHDVYIVQTDTGGNPLWGDMYGGVGQEAALAMDRTHDDQYIITGHTSSQGAGGFDVYLIRYALANQVIEAPAAGLDMRMIRVRPNPFCSSTSIEFEIGSTDRAFAQIFDYSGRLVKSLKENVRLPAPRHRLEWSGDDDTGQSLPSGVYFLRIAGGDAVGLVKLILRR